jgi:uncharacterized protein (TIGR02996 family)
MPTEADFLRAIIADPDSDGPRLVYADWREECGDSARAEFIRVQCALAALPAGDRTYHPLLELQAKLEAAHRAEWLRPFGDLLSQHAAVIPGRWRWWARRPRTENPIAAAFRRGFVDYLQLDMAEFARHAGQLTRMTPLRAVTLQSTDSLNLGPADVIRSTNTWESLTMCPDLGGLKHIHVRSHRLSPVEMRSFTECRYLGNLVELGLINPGFHRQAIEVLCASSLLSRLSDLSIVALGEDQGHACADLLLFETTSRHLETLFLSRMFDVDADFLQQLTRLPPFSRLDSLTLNNCPVGDTDLGVFLEWLPDTIGVLELSSLELGDRAAVSIATTPRLRGLKKLDMKSNRIGDAGAMALADSPNLLASTGLVLWGNPISERVKNALRIRCGHHVLV